MSDPKISLRVWGTKFNLGGWNPLVTLNDPPFPSLEDKRPSGLGENIYYYLVRIHRDYTQFTLVYNPSHVRASDASRDGALKVSFSIPKGYVLDKGANPYNVFMELQNLLETVLISKIPGSDDVYKFRTDDTDVAAFKMALDAFSLRPSQTPHRPMSDSSEETAIIIADEAKTELVLQDVQYPEFSPYKEIALAKFGNGKILTNLEVPRKGRYEIFANSMNITSSLKSYNYGYSDMIVLNVLEWLGLSQVAYENRIIEFTVEEALNGKCPEIIRVDRAREEIHVTLPTPPQKRKKYYLKLSGVSDNSLFKKIRFLVNHKDKSIACDNSIELVGEELIGIPAFSFILNSSDYEKNGTPDFNGYEIIIPVKKIEKPVVVENRNHNNRRDRDNRFDSSIAPKHEPDVITLNISLEDAKDIGNLDQSFKIDFRNSNRSFSQLVKFSKLKPFGRAAYVTQLVIPKAWEGSYKLSFVTDKVKYTSEGVYALTPGKDSTFDIFIDRNHTEALSWCDLHKKTLKWLIWIGSALVYTAAVAVITMIIYHAVEDYKHRHRAEDREKTEQAESTPEFRQGAVDPSQNGTQDDTAQQITKMQAALAQEAVTFAEIREINDFINSHEEDMAKIPEGVTLKNRVKVYMQLIDVLEKPDKRTLVAIEKVYNDNNKLADLEEKHRKYIENLWPPQKPNYKTNRKYVEQRLKEKRNYISFLDIPAAEDIVKSHTSSTPPSNPPRPDNGKNNTEGQGSKGGQEGGSSSSATGVER